VLPLLFEHLDLSQIQDERARACIVRLLNLVEEVTAALRASQEENQRLRDAINRLKGEQGQPKIKGNASKLQRLSSTNYSSEAERRDPKGWSKGAKTARISIDREQVLEVERVTLPPDAQFKGYEDVIVQDVIFQTDNVCFHKEKFYSPSQHQSYLAPLPPGYTGQFGPGIKALSIVLAFGANVSEPKILDLFRNVGVQISDGELSNLLIHHQDQFHTEKAAVVEAGLGSGPWQHLDQTSTRVAGQNQQCQIIGNPLYTAFATTATKDRLSVLDVLRNGRPRTFLLNAEAERWLDQTGLSPVIRRQVARLPYDQMWDEATLGALLEQHLPDVGPQQRRWIMDATAVAAYHAEDGSPITRLLVCDDAPQFAGVTEELALCWVHEGRHYKKLTPYLAPLQATLAEFLTRFWSYYRELQAYRQQPTGAERERLAARFDEVFTPTTDYYSLDDRIAKTRAKKAELLKVLEHPEIPLHNNPAELGARVRVRKRDVSFGPRTVAGAKAWDTFQTLGTTARQLGVSFFAYVYDRIAQTNHLPGLDQVIQARAKDLNLGMSWTPS